MYCGFTILLRQWGKEKKKMTLIWGKKTKEKQNSVNIKISVVGKDTVFSVKLKKKAESFE